MNFQTFPQIVNSSDKFVSDQSFERRQKWLEAVGLETSDEKTFVCSKHFVSGKLLRLIFTECILSLKARKLSL